MAKQLIEFTEREVIDLLIVAARREGILAERDFSARAQVESLFPNGFKVRLIVDFGPHSEKVE